MQFLKRIQPLFLSVSLIICCLTFQADTSSATTSNLYSTWITNSSDQSKSDDIYKIKVRKAETIIGNNFSIFSFKCFFKQRKSLLATNYKQQLLLLLPQHPDYLKFSPQTSNSEDHILIG